MHHDQEIRIAFEVQQCEATHVIKLINGCQRKMGLGMREASEVEENSTLTT